MCSDEDPRANVRVIVKDANLQVVDVIEGYCRKPVDVAMVTFNDEGQVTLLRSDEAWRQATISVSLEHLDPSSWHVPFITIVYLSQAADAVAISQSQANKKFLKSYLSSRFSTRTAQSLARKIVNHVNYYSQYQYFCFYVAA